VDPHRCHGEAAWISPGDPPEGGAGGGASALSPQAAALLEKFHALKKDFNDTVNRKFHKLRF
jgi:molybdenum-dependent DNA-binding transcriptional regulator ModE